ncbi:hypothetical protein Tco_0363440 [Tanacetum coccineum]
MFSYSSKNVYIVTRSQHNILNSTDDSEVISGKELPTKIELTLEKIQQGVSNDVCSQAVNKSPTHYPLSIVQNIRVLICTPIKMENTYLSITKQSLVGYINEGDVDALFPVETDSLPHAHAQTTKAITTKHRDSRINMKAQWN